MGNSKVKRSIVNSRSLAENTQCLLCKVSAFHIQKGFDHAAVDAFRVLQFRAFRNEAVLVFVEQADVQRARLPKELPWRMEFEKRKVIAVASRIGGELPHAVASHYVVRKNALRT